MPSDQRANSAAPHLVGAVAKLWLGPTRGPSAPARTNPHTTTYFYSNAVAADTYPGADGYPHFASQRPGANRHAATGNGDAYPQLDIDEHTYPAHANPAHGDPHPARADPATSFSLAYVYHRASSFAPPGNSL